MNYNKLKKVIASLALATVCLPVSISQADALDVYRNMINKHSYTIKTEAVTPETRVENKDAYNMTGNSSLDISQITQFENRPVNCIAVANGNKNYMEADSGHNLAICTLNVDDETFNFTKYTMNGKTEYFGDKAGSVKAVHFNSLAAMYAGNGYGINDISRLINAMLNEDNVPEGSMIYSKVGEGTLSNGLSYVDYRGKDTNIKQLEVIRYYLQQGKLIKIVSAIYYFDENWQIADGRRCIVNVKEFKAEPENQYLELPNGLKDNTNRKN